MKAIFLDIDGTLFNGFIGIEFVNFISGCGIVDKQFKESQIKILSDYKNKKIDYYFAINQWLLLWAKNMTGLEKSKIDLLAKDFFEKFKQNFFQFVPELVKTAHLNDFKIIGVSSGVSTLMDLVKDYLNLDFIFSNQLIIKNGVYLDHFENDLSIKGGKKLLINKLVVKYNIDLTNSFAIGDSEQDFEMFDLVGKGILINSELNLPFELSKHVIIATQKNILSKLKFFMS